MVISIFDERNCSLNERIVASINYIMRNTAFFEKVVATFHFISFVSASNSLQEFQLFGGKLRLCLFSLFTFKFIFGFTDKLI